MTEARCRSRLPARCDDLLTVETGVLELGRVTVRFGCRARRAESRRSPA